MIRSLKGAHQKTLGADKGYDAREFVADLRISGVTPHVAQNISRSGGSAIDGRTARHQGYAQSIGRTKVAAVFRLHVVAYNLIRITNLQRAQRQQGATA